MTRWMMGLQGRRAETDTPPAQRPQGWLHSLLGVDPRGWVCSFPGCFEDSRCEHGVGGGRDWGWVGSLPVPHQAQACRALGRRLGVAEVEGRTGLL